MEPKIAGSAELIARTVLDRYYEQMEGLRTVVSQSAKKSTSEIPDDLFFDYQNVFVKAYLVSACSILEAFIQDIAMEYVNLVQRRLHAANLPFNFVTWLAGNEKAKLEFKSFQHSVDRRDIIDMVSPNFYKTIKVFERIGVNLRNEEFSQFADFVTTTIEKRNKIVHENDDASDISYADVEYVIVRFRQYMQCIFNAVTSDPHLAVT